MKFAILAAGEGRRLREEGAATPKPLTEINGETLIDRLIRIFNNNGAKEIVVIVNEETNLVKQHIQNNYPAVICDGTNISTRPDSNPQGTATVRLVTKTTKSSMHSFFEISKYLEDGKFCLTTVDTIFNESDFGAYIEAWNGSSADGLMAVTPFVDDEKPLYVSVDRSMRITGFHDTIPSSNDTGIYVSGGIYGLTPKCIPVLNHCMAANMSRMRNFQRQMVGDGLKLMAYPFQTILDVDHVGDVAKATQFLGRQ